MDHDEDKGHGKKHGKVKTKKRHSRSSEPESSLSETNESTIQTEGEMKIPMAPVVPMPMMFAGPQIFYGGGLGISPFRKQVGGTCPRIAGAVLYSLYLFEWATLCVIFFVFYGITLEVEKHQEHNAYYSNNDAQKESLQKQKDATSSAYTVAAFYFLFSFLWICFQLSAFACLCQPDQNKKLFLRFSLPVFFTGLAMANKVSMGLTVASLLIALVYMCINLYVNVATGSDLNKKFDLDLLITYVLIFVNWRFTAPLGWLHFFWLTTLAAFSGIHLYHLMKFSSQQSQTNLGDNSGPQGLAGIGNNMVGL